MFLNRFFSVLVIVVLLGAAGLIIRAAIGTPANVTTGGDTAIWPSEARYTAMFTAPASGFNRLECLLSAYPERVSAQCERYRAAPRPSR